MSIFIGKVTRLADEQSRGFGRAYTLKTLESPDVASSRSVSLGLPQTSQRLPHKASLSSRFSSGVACSIVRLIISRNSDRGQIMNAPRAHDSQTKSRFQGWIAKADVIDYGEPLRLLSGALVRGALVLITPARLAYLIV
jgi:hypothetical protein